MTEIGTLMLTISGSLIVVLGSVLWWFIRERMRARERTEHLLDKRLAAGAETMHSLRVSIEKLQMSLSDIMSNVVTINKCDAVQRDHVTEHKDIDKKFDSFREQLSNFSNELTSMRQRLEGGLSTITSMLSKRIEIDNED